MVLRDQKVILRVKKGVVKSFLVHFNGAYALTMD